jgi:hypothetical protein
MSKKTSKKTHTQVIGDLHAEIKRREARVAEAEVEMELVMQRAQGRLEAARADLREYQGKIAEALGLPNPHAREAARLATLERKRRVRELLDAGETEEEICAALSIEPSEARAIVTKIEGQREKLVSARRSVPARGEDDAGEDVPGEAPAGRMPPGSGKRGWKRQRVLDLYRAGIAAGKTRKQLCEEIAEEIDITPTSVSTHLSVLRASGELDVAEAGVAGRPASSDEARGDGDGDGDGDEDGDDGDSVDDLKVEVFRQQGGQRGKTVRLPTTIAGEDEHEHVACLDRMGDGVTAPDEHGPQHRIYRFVMQAMGGHRHGLLAKEAPSPA